VEGARELMIPPTAWPLGWQHCSAKLPALYGVVACLLGTGRWPSPPPAQSLERSRPFYALLPASISMSNCTLQATRPISLAPSLPLY
jgi:hypothetical protein